MLTEKEFKQLITQYPLKIIIGASSVSQKSWIPTEQSFLDLLNPNDWRKYFNYNSIDAILAEHVWEHLTREDAFIAANRCYDYLKPGGYIRVAVPDGYNPNQSYLESVKPFGTGVGAEDHKVLYKYTDITKIFKEACFQIKMLEYYDEEGYFHFINWDPEDGKIVRSKRFDPRNTSEKINYNSIIFDAVK